MRIPALSGSALIILLLTACGSPTPETPPPASTTTPPASGGPPSTPPPSDGLFKNVGAHHHAIATTSPEAQKFFDQGFNLVFGFNHEEAARSFKRAAELDPKAAMPHWGIAWALGPNYNLDVDDDRSKQAYAAMEQAMALSAGGSPAERAYIETMAIRFSTDPKADRPALARKYSERMRDLSRQFPDDLDAATLYAESLMNLRPWKLWSLDGKPADKTEEIVAVLESVLARDPNHLGANHYYIHTVEASASAARALPSATRLQTLAPAAGHLVHMPAHVYARTGDHGSAARANTAGAEADREYFKVGPSDSFYAMAYYSHNLHFLADSEMMQGRFAAAKEAGDAVAKHLTPHAQMMPMVESMIAIQTAVLLRFGRHDDILKLVEPPADRPVEVAWWRFARGVALARTGKLAEATAERAALTAAVAKVPDTALFGGTGLESARTVLAIAGTVLDARLAWARGAQADAIRFWRSAVSAADKLAYDEPPVWFYPVRESLGAALLLNGQHAEAERVFRADQVKNPRNARSLFGLHESLVRQGKSADAAWVKRQFDDAWKNADTTLSVEAL